MLPAEAAVNVATTKHVEPAAVFDGAKAGAVVATAPAIATPVEVAERYVTALNARDQPALDALYAKDARFDDNVFHFKNSAGIVGMWNKLPADARVQHQIVGVDGNTVQAKLAWDYTLVGKKVHNDVTSTLTIVDGKITNQQERFDFGTWAHQLVPLPRALLNFAEPVLTKLIGMFT